MSALLLVLLAIVLTAFAQGCAEAPGGYDPGQIYVCGGDEVFLIDAQAARADPAARLWSWRAEDSPQIALQHRAWFSAMDECKPVLGGSAVLVSSSSAGGLALVRRADKKCLFYASGHNAHSAELIGQDLLAGAFSFGSDQLRLYRLGREDLPASPVWTMDLRGAHGVVWDRARSVLWALGNSELLELTVRAAPEPSAQVLRRWNLPGPGGHDLFPLDAEHLGVTVGDGVYRFSVASESFGPFQPLAGQARVKSVCPNGETGTLIYSQGEPTFTNKVRFPSGEPIVLSSNRLYKARWNVANRFSYAP